MLSVPAADRAVVLQEEETSSDSETAAAVVVAIGADRPEIENVYKTLKQCFLNALRYI